MPCNSDYMEASDLEVECSVMASILDQLDGKIVPKNYWRGYHPRVYNATTRALADQLARTLCDRLQAADVSEISLEAQIWWRDHKAADAARLRIEAMKNASREAQEAALAKLTDADKKALGL